MPVKRPPRDTQLDRHELSALRGISKGLLIQTITPEHVERLKSLGYIQDNPGGLTGVRMTVAGKAYLGK